MASVAELAGVSAILAAVDSDRLPSITELASVTSEGIPCGQFGLRFAAVLGFLS